MHFVKHLDFSSFLVLTTLHFKKVLAQKVVKKEYESRRKGGIRSALCTTRGDHEIGGEPMLHSSSANDTLPGSSKFQRAVWRTPFPVAGLASRRDEQPKQLIWSVLTPGKNTALLGTRHGHQQCRTTLLVAWTTLEPTRQSGRHSGRQFWRQSEGSQGS